MPHFVSKSLYLWFVAALLVLLLDTALCVFSIRRLVSNRDHAEQSRQFIEQVERVLSAARDAETGQRGFIITGKEEYLEPYHWAQRALETSLPELTQIAGRERSQDALVTQYVQLIQEKMANALEMIEVRRSQGSEAAHALVSSNKGKAVMDQARLVARQIVKREEEQLADRAAQSRRSERNAMLATGIAGVLNLGLLFEIFRRARTAAILELRNKGELERRVEDRTTELRDANAQLEAFTYTVSHDLRAPLRGMQGFAEAVQEDYGDRLDDEGQDYLRRIVAAAQRMERLIEDLLTYSRLSRAELNLAPVHLPNMIRDALQALQQEIESAGATVTINEPMPPVRAHASTLVQVLQNLLANALKFARPGEKPQVKIWTERIDNHVRLWVEDQGIGIALEHSERIFQVFERLHGQETFPGTGIGLAIVKKGAERMGGTCGVESEPARGSRFWLSLPVASESAR